jgi:hypothetical protein
LNFEIAKRQIGKLVQFQKLPIEKFQYIKRE